MIPTPDPDQFVDVSPKRLNAAERLFLPSVFKGLGTTLRHCLGNVGRDGKNAKNIHVIQYPEEKRDDRDVEEGGQTVFPSLATSYCARQGANCTRPGEPEFVNLETGVAADEGRDRAGA